MSIRFALCISLGVLVAPVQAGVMTVGIYDENVIAANTVDFVAAGSSFNNLAFAASVAAAYANDSGGVLDATVLGLYWDFGVTHTRTLLEDVPTNWGIATYLTAISGTGIFATSNWPGNSVDFVFGGIIGGNPNERVVQVGVTALSLTDDFTGWGVDFGLVTATASLSGGGQLAASRYIAETTWLGDTFFGFAAPPGQWITEFSLAAANSPRYFGALQFDDLGFITAVPAAVPEPSTAGLLLLAGLLAAGRKLIRRYRPN